MKKSAMLAIAASVALAVPAAVQAKPDKPPKADKPAKGVSYVFKGVYSGDGSTVAVDHTNRHARDFDGQTVAFDFSAARFSVADMNGDGQDLADVLAGDRVVVKAKLPKSEPGDQPFAARKVVDQTHPAPDETETE